MLPGVLPQLRLPPRVARLNVLLSYAYLRKSPSLTVYADTLARTGAIRLLVDSGAFTDYNESRAAAAAGKTFRPIDLGAYCEWIREREPRLWGYVALDKIRDDAATARNLAAMVARGLRPMPVVVIGGDVRALAPDLAAINPRLCVAGGVESTTAWLGQRIWRVWEATEGRALPHALGFVQPPHIFQWPVATFDASSWNAGDRFGTLMWVDPRTGQVSSVGASVARAGTTPRGATGRAQLLRSGVTRAMLTEDVHWRGAGGVTAVLSPCASLTLAHRAALQGRHLFFAAATTKQLHYLAAAAAATRPGAESSDYPTALRHFRALEAASKADAAEGARRTAALLLASTGDAGYPEAASFTASFAARAAAATAAAS